ncbi:SIMPL domain-containing protein [Candidatus Woesearchaeota archaeon]|nr:SIMPL domain-containing protein [Candidatus Woesearchaeota archaeon]MBT5271800.1 SIMPL domain-containing protein [Candidatus Woesearchaeota archaeon]MBT6040681.1 SIMPL domain-containing protein [Candidatus Woesearchaeota archaeon]MBT6336442.1 SIMPL domain-containing protein [Candidatus Woesearchaeota archaeon]MBT7926778.1 SIMPL domain-containing protein [Candidatus Woesearchaeota archaeon]
MEHKTGHMIVFGIILVLLAGMLYSIGTKDYVINQGNMNKISVSGDAESDVMPDEVEISFSVVTDGKDAATVQEQNSEKMNAVMAALEKAGLDENEIETTDYNLYPLKEYDYVLKKQVDKGYRLTQTIKVTTTDIDKTGELLTVGVQNGANKISNINFQLSKKLEKQVKDELVKEATTNAKEKAKTLAKNLDVKMGKAISISESNYYTPRYYAGGFGEEAIEEMAVMDAVSSKISPEQVGVSLSINVDFAIV